MKGGIEMYKSIRISPEAYAYIEQKAKEDRRSITKTIDIIIEEYSDEEQM